ncbi:hypothetical protein [uncultured Alistipes sp.]|uniref:hypothetical protein n=1 Tax=uncultured Alistipes sp. TaxID=538949 RepID=UPI002610DD7E|nr:hypothetical protein [uncultured Alistipes sp.]
MAEYLFPGILQGSDGRTENGGGGISTAARIDEMMRCSMSFRPTEDAGSLFYAM